MKYAITGSRGFIGTALSKRLTGKGHTVIPVNRYAFNDLNTTESYFNSINPDFIVHLAAYGNHYSQNDLRETVSANVISTINIFLGAKCPVYNFTSSSLNLKVQTPYSITKQIGQMASQLFPNVINVMPYSVYGMGEGRHRFIPVVIDALINGKEILLDESATHDWIFIDSFIDAFLNGHTVIGSGKKYTNLEIVRKLELIAGKKLRYKKARLRKYDNPDWVCPGGVECLSIEEGLLRTYKFYKDAD